MIPTNKHPGSLVVLAVLWPQEPARFRRYCESWNGDRFKLELKKWSVDFYYIEICRNWKVPLKKTNLYLRVHIKYNLYIYITDLFCKPNLVDKISFTQLSTWGGLFSKPIFQKRQLPRFPKGSSHARHLWLRFRLWRWRTSGLPMAEIPRPNNHLSRMVLKPCE